MNLPEKPTIKQHTKSSKKIKYSIFGWISLVIILFAVYVLKDYISSQINSAKSNVDSGKLISDTSWKLYTSTQDGFSVSFPGLPVSENASIDVEGYAIPYATYERDNGDSYLLIGVYKYPSNFDMSDVNARLEGALNGSIQNTQGASLDTSEYIQLDGRKAIKAKYIVSQSGQTIVVRYLATMLGNTLYLLMGSCDEPDFDIFINSFHVIQ